MQIQKLKEQLAQCVVEFISKYYLIQPNPQAENKFREDIIRLASLKLPKDSSGPHPFDKRVGAVLSTYLFSTSAKRVPLKEGGAGMRMGGNPVEVKQRVSDAIALFSLYAQDGQIVKIKLILDMIQGTDYQHTIGILTKVNWLQVL